MTSGFLPASLSECYSGSTRNTLLAPVKKQRPGYDMSEIAAFSGFEESELSIIISLDCRAVVVYIA